MTARRLLIAMLLATAAVFPSFAETMKFTPAAFEAAQKSGKPVLVDITAPWCPVCKAQKPILSGLTSQQKYKDYIVLDVDFDSQKDVVKNLKASSQSTLIVFKGSQEAGRSAGDTNPTTIEALLAKAI